MTTTRTASTSVEVEERLAFAEAGLALAGHQVTDPFVRDLGERVARQEITADQAVAEIRRRHLEG